MIRTFIHSIDEPDKRDTDVNNFTNEHGSWATTTNNTMRHIITTVFYGKKKE